MDWREIRDCEEIKGFTAKIIERIWPDVFLKYDVRKFMECLDDQILIIRLEDMLDEKPEKKFLDKFQEAANFKWIVKVYGEEYYPEKKAI